MRTGGGRRLRDLEHELAICATLDALLVAHEPLHLGGQRNLPLRGVLTFRPLPRITSLKREGSAVHISWDGPDSVLMEEGVPRPAQHYLLERADTVTGGTWTPVTEPSPGRSASALAEPGQRAFYRVRLFPNEPPPQ